MRKLTSWGYNIRQRNITFQTDCSCGFFLFFHLSTFGHPHNETRIGLILHPRYTCAHWSSLHVIIAPTSISLTQLNIWFTSSPDIASPATVQAFGGVGLASVSETDPDQTSPASRLRRRRANQKTLTSSICLLVAGVRGFRHALVESWAVVPFGHGAALQRRLKWGVGGVLGGGAFDTGAAAANAGAARPRRLGQRWLRRLGQRWLRRLGQRWLRRLGQRWLRRLGQRWLRRQRLA